MGYMRHDAIVATSSIAEHLQAAHTKAKELGLPVSEIVEGHTNNENSFLIAPDGSKERWPESDAGDEQREAWKSWMRSQEEMWVDWAHVNFGGDDDQLSSLRDHSGAEAPAPLKSRRLRSRAGRNMGAASFIRFIFAQLKGKTMSEKQTEIGASARPGVRRYRKKPVEIEAVRWSGENVATITRFLESQKGRVGMDYVEITTLEGTMRADIGDFIIKGVKGEFYPCKPDIFEATYEAV